ncbi:hypothetical protein LuPra_00804 [Luteitalea pratensis]|uniref:DUF4157 domain-containing protein n=1 Tax=Luteitalea pratensis TaxID=1855912 RepID=A0A143PH73_LUTPR|nr:hypothetical protein [Luteitalea pratensis]AMY07630.1 hypothetical protein LuPra_00804 [Luteitalea pratensis]
MSQLIGGGRALAGLVLGILLGSSTAVAQPVLPDGGAARDSLTTLDLLMPEVVGASSAASAVTARVVVDAKLQGLVDDLLGRSPAFRRQWQRLERFPRLSIRIELVHANQIGGDAHAATTIAVLHDGSVDATVAIPGGRRLPELVAHEVEHILERLDGVNAANQHALGDHSVRRASGTFETARAVLVGQLVAKQVQPR